MFVVYVPSNFGVHIKILSNNVDWSGHYSITAKAYKILGLLRRCFKTNSIDAKRKLYISLVRSHLLYCSPIWRPYNY